MDRLLDVIDQFAAAEGRMKWAPNKKLHFEVAIIKAIQTLGQATLDEVIERLGELRDGKTITQKESSPVVAGGPAQSVAAIGDAGREESRTQKTGVTAPGYSKVAERVESDQPNSSDLWQKVLAKIPAKSFLRTLSELIRPIGIDGRNFLLGHAPDDKPKVEALASANNRRQLETLLSEASGRDWSVKFVVKDGTLPSTADAAKPAESFKDDPLIQQAMKLFNAEIKT
jgi:DNA polymerase III subunit gamma/tau